MSIESASLIWTIIAGTIAGIFTALVAAMAALWAYTRFVLERGLLPPTQFNIECSPVGRQQGATVLEVKLRLRNLGPAALIVRDLRLDLRYLTSSDDLTLFDEPNQPSFGRLRFAHSIWRDLGYERPKDAPRGSRVIKYDTFVQGGADQIYPFVTSVPSSTAFILIWASFQYAQNPSLFQLWILRLSRRLGLVQYSLDDVTKPHKAERAFSIEVQNKDRDRQAIDTAAG